MSLNQELDQLVSEFSMEILIFHLGCQLHYPSAVVLISLMDPVVSDQLDLEFWLHLVWCMGILGVLIFVSDVSYHRDLVHISVTHIFDRPPTSYLPWHETKYIG